MTNKRLCWVCWMTAVLAMSICSLGAFAYPGEEVQEQAKIVETEKWKDCDEVGPGPAKAVRWSVDGHVMAKDSKKECIIENVFCKNPDGKEYGSYYRVKKADGSWVVFGRTFGITKNEDGSWNTDQMATALMLNDGSWDSGNYGDSLLGVQPIWRDSTKKDEVLGAKYCLLCLRDGATYQKTGRAYCDEEERKKWQERRKEAEENGEDPEMVE